MNGFSFYKTAHGMATDLRWLGIGRKVGLSPMLVAGFFSALLDYASQQDDRGSLAGLPLRDLAAFADVPVESLRALYDELVADGRITAEDRLANWRKHQDVPVWTTARPPAPRRRPKTPAERAQDARDRKRKSQQSELALTPDADAPEPPSRVTNRHVTRHENVTPRHDSALRERDDRHGDDLDICATDQSVAPVSSRAATESESEKEEEQGFVRSERARDPVTEVDGLDGVVVLERHDLVDQEFDLWWGGIEHQVGVSAARLGYRKARIDGATGAEIAEGWSHYARTKPPDRLWMNPANWLREERWRDRPAVTAAGPPSPDAGLGPHPNSPVRTEVHDGRRYTVGASRFTFGLDAREGRRAAIAAEVDRRMAARGAAAGAG